MERYYCKVFANVAGSGQFYSGPCVVVAIFVGNHDEINDPGFGLYNGTDNTGGKFVPHNMVDASAKGMNGATLGFEAYFPAGCFVDITDNDLTVSIWGRKV